MHDYSCINVYLWQVFLIQTCKMYILHVVLTCFVCVCFCFSESLKEGQANEEQKWPVSDLCELL